MLSIAQSNRSLPYPLSLPFPIPYHVSQICVDLFAAPPSTQLLSAPTQATKNGGAPIQGYLDLATLSLLPEVTGGQVWHYPSFHPGIHGQALSADIVASLQRQTAWEVRSWHHYKLTICLDDAIS